jgi:FkbH-like protein
MEKAKNIDEFLKSLNMKVEVSINDVSKLARISQLTQKTNQFNLTGKSFSVNEAQNLIQSKHIIFSGNVKDKLSEHGIVLVAIIYINNSSAEIINYYMSCRVFSRNLEFDFLIFIINYLKRTNIDLLKCSFVLTDKNINFSKFYSEAGFDLTSSSDNSLNYVFNMVNIGKLSTKKFSKVSFS